MFLLLASMLLLCSCKDGFGRVKVDDSDKKADARMEQLIEAIKREDKVALKAMFSKQALSEADDFDGNLNTLFNYIQGEIQSWKSTGAYSFPEEKMLTVTVITKKKPNQHMFLPPVNKNIMLQYMSIQSILPIQIMWVYIHFVS